MRNLRLGSALALAGALLGSGCYGPDPNITESGKGLPTLSVTFPKTVAAGSTQTAELTVDNPGPGDMPNVVVFFTRVGTFFPIIEAVPARNNPAVVAIDPEPEGVSLDGLGWVFAGPEEGASVTISFTLRMPERLGDAANAVTVSDSQELDRVRGVRLETTVTAG